MGARSPGLRVLLAAVLVGGGCGGGKSTPDAAPGDAPSGIDAACPGAYERITAEDSGHELAVAYREHVPTANEKVMAVALYAVLIRATQEELDVDLFQRLAAEGTLSAIPGLYPTAFRPCGAPISTMQGAVISDPFRCTDDCRITRDEVFAILVAPLITGLRILGTQSMVIGDVIKMTNDIKMALVDPTLTGQALQNAVAMAIGGMNVDAFLTTVFETIGKAAAVSAGIAELIGAGQVGPALAAAAAVIAIGVVAVRLQMLANKINACRQWKAENCRCMNSPSCACAALGFPSRGVMCCGQGGPTVDGQGWYVVTASSTCCVLNRAEYSKHSQMCWAPPDKTPGPCPECLSDAECCDRTGAPGNIDSCVAGRCCGRDGPARPNTPTVVDFSCCSGVRYQVNSTERTCAPAP